MLKHIALCHLPKKLMTNMVKKLMDTATKTGIDAAKTASKTVIQKIADAIGDLIGNIIANKITLAGKSKEHGKTRKVDEIYIPPEKGSKQLMT